MTARIPVEWCGGIRPTAHSAPRLSSALRAPPLCRCAERTADLILRLGRKQRGGQSNEGVSNEGVRSCFATSNEGVTSTGAATRGSGLVLPHRGGRVFFANVAKQDLTPVLAPGCACRDAGLFVFGRSGSGLPRTRPCMRTSAGSGLVLPYRNARPDPFPRARRSRNRPHRAAPAATLGFSYSGGRGPDFPALDHACARPRGQVLFCHIAMQDLTPSRAMQDLTPSRVTPSREHRRVSSDIRRGA